jgi:hypothetical protein
VHLYDPIWLDTLADRTGAVRLDRLADLVADHDVVVGELLDEELRMVGSGPPPDPDLHWTPRLAQLDVRGRETATEVALRHAVAFGLIEDLDGGAGEVSPLLTVPSDEFTGAIAQLTWTHRCGDDDPAHEAMLLRPDGTVLHDEIDAGDGLHLLAFRSAERARAVVSAVLDVRPDADDVNPHPDAGQPHPDGAAAVAAGSVASCHLARAAVWDTADPARAVTTHATADGGLWLIDQRDPAAAPSDPVRTDVPTVRRLAAELLAVTGP